MELTKTIFWISSIEAEKGDGGLIESFKRSWVKDNKRVMPGRTETWTQRFTERLENL